ncbi:MAG: hypothetical protein JNM43_07700 [Planctomycetaceae bacterium]|nr:hypothetical protein [Planctomycetaceae bacterium]
MNWQLIFSGLKSPGWAAYAFIGVLCALGMSFWLLRLERRIVSRTVGWTLLTLRVLVLLTLLLTMLQPILTKQFDVTQRGKVVVALDVSESMETQDRHASMAEKLRWAQSLGMLGNAETKPLIDRWVADAEAGREPNWLGTDAPPANAAEQAQADSRRRQVMDSLDELSRMPRTEFVRRLLLSQPGTLLKNMQEVMPVELRLFATEQEVVESAALAKRLTDDRSNIQPGGSDPVGMLDKLMAEEGADEIRGVVILSDGRQTTAGDVTQEAQRMASLGVPVYSVPIGSKLPPRDLSLAAVEAPEAVFVNDKAQILAVIGTSGFEGEELEVQLERDGAVVEIQKITPSSDTASLTFAVPTTEVGRFEYKIKTKVQAGELREDNNIRDVSLQVVDNKARVMLVDGDARWEFRYLRNLLERDKQVEPATVLFRQPYLQILNEPSIQNTLPPLEAFRQQLSRTDLLILGDVDPKEIDQPVWQLLEEAIARDGLTLVVIPGRRAMPLGFQSPLLSSLLPVTEPHERLAENFAATIDDSEQSAFRLRLTPEAQSLPMFQLSNDPSIRDASLSSLPGHPWIFAGTPKPGANLWATASVAGSQTDPESVIVHHDYGFGQVVWMGVDSTWRWRRRAGDEWHYKFWGQLVRWAARNKAAAGNNDVRLTLSDVVIDENESAEAVVRWDRRLAAQLQGATVEVIAEPIEADGSALKPPAGQEAAPIVAVLQPVPGSPERYSGRLPHLAAGSWKVRLNVTGGTIPSPQQIQTELVVRRQMSVELANVSCNRDLLTQLSTQSGGAVVEPWEAERLTTLIQPKDQPEQKLEEKTLWDHWVILAAFFCLLTAEWVIRKLNGLP